MLPDLELEPEELELENFGNDHAEMEISSDYVRPESGMHMDYWWDHQRYQLQLPLHQL